MARIILVTGGARSGKSTFAESFYQTAQGVVYIATTRIEDEDMAERVRRHQASRPREWRTVEATSHLRQIVSNERHYLLDCITMLASHIMFSLTGDAETISSALQARVEERVWTELRSLIQGIKHHDAMLVMVTNEVGYSIVPVNQVARVYRDIIGRLNQRVASLCDEVYLVVCGIPLKVK